MNNCKLNRKLKSAWYRGDLRQWLYLKLTHTRSLCNINKNDTFRPIDLLSMDMDTLNELLMKQDKSFMRTVTVFNVCRETRLATAKHWFTTPENEDGDNLKLVKSLEGYVILADHSDIVYAGGWDSYAGMPYIDIACTDVTNVTLGVYNIPGTLKISIPLLSERLDELNKRVVYCEHHDEINADVSKQSDYDERFYRYLKTVIKNNSMQIKNIAYELKDGNDESEYPIVRITADVPDRMLTEDLSFDMLTLIRTHASDPHHKGDVNKLIGWMYNNNGHSRKIDSLFSDYIDDTAEPIETWYGYPCDRERMIEFKEMNIHE